MKKKNLFLSIFFSLLLIFSAQTFRAENTANAVAGEVITYKISVSEDKYNVTSTSNQVAGTNTVATALDSLSLAFAEIQENATNNDVEVLINFDSVTLTEDLVVPFESSTFTGIINLDSYSLVFASSTSQKTLSLTQLKLNATGDQNLVRVIKGTFADGETEETLTLNTSAVEYRTTSTAETYAVYFETANALFNVSTSLVHETTYFYNFYEGVLVTIEKPLDLSGQASGKFAIPVPYTLDNTTLIQYCHVSSSSVDFVELDDFYTCESGGKNGLYLIVKCKINTEFDPNGGALSASYTRTGVEYKSETDILFPTAEQITKTDHTLKGFLGKAVVDGTTYYFDKTSITNFAATGFDKNLIAEEGNFFTTIDPDANYSYFTSYKYDQEEIDPSYLAIKYFIEEKTNATFIADWEPTIYTINFDSVGGTPVDSISNLSGTAITLPTPEKPGHTFLGWFDGTNPNKYELTTMPSENLNLVAEWERNVHKLTITLNNGTSNIEINVPYGTDLTTLTELDSTLYSKTGHTFDKWYSNDTLSTPFTLEVMPDEDVNVYANWTLNTYVVEMYYNNVMNMTLFHSAPFAYGANITSLASMTPSVNGYKFLGWFTDRDGEISYTFDKMPDNNVVLYANWSYVNYTLTFHYNNASYTRPELFNINQVINSKFPENPTLDGYNFGGWYADPEFTQEINLNEDVRMPAKNFDIYAKMIEKLAVDVTAEAQTYNQTKFEKFNLITKHKDCVVEYLVGNKWTQEVPTETGTYDIRISRPEDDTYKALLIVIEDGLTITPDPIDLTWVYALGYAITVLELIAILFVLVLIKRKKALSTLAIALPIGLIPTGTFVNIIISFVLALAGFVTLIVLLVKLSRITIYEDTRTEEDKLEEARAKIKDVSTNETISKNVDDLLKKEGFVDEE